jgi:uncharacterized protein (TIGR03435 family)
VDFTHLEGSFDVKLQWAPDWVVFRGQTPPIFNAVREQLGLRLVAKKAVVDVLVVDSVERTPAEN